MRLLVLCLCLSSCSLPPPGGLPTEVSPAEAVPENELLEVNDVLIDTPPPFYPHPALADSLREVLGYRASGADLDVYVVDQGDQRISEADFLRSVEAGLPAGTSAVILFEIAWNGMPYRVEAIAVEGDVPREVVARAVERVRFHPPHNSEVEAVLPPDVPSFVSASWAIRFNGSG